MLINISNQPSSTWQLRQRNSAIRTYGKIVDIPFPEIDPEWDTDRIIEEVATLSQMIMTEYEFVAVHVMGEMTFTHALVNELLLLGHVCVASTTRIEVVKNPDGTTTTRFVFVRFREYDDRFVDEDEFFEDEF